MEQEIWSISRQVATRPTGCLRGYTPLPDDVLENPVHPDLYLKIYRQNERELEQRLLQRFAADERAAGGQRKARGRRVAHLLHHRKDTPHL